MRGILGTCSTGTSTARACPWRRGGGGLDNHGVLVEGSLEAIRQETLKIIEAMGKRGFMLGADCTVPGEIDWARLRAAVEAAAEV